MNPVSRIALFSILMCLSLSLGAEDQRAGSGTDTSASNLERVASGYAAFAEGNVPAVLAMMSPAVVWHEAESLPYGGVHHGPEEVLENIFSPILGDWDDYEAEPLRLIDGGDHIVALGEYRGVHRKTGHRLQVPFAHIWHMEDGLLVEFHQFTDTMAWMEAAGLASHD